MKMGLLIIAVVALLFLVSNYSNKQTEGFANLLDDENFEDPEVSEEGHKEGDGPGEEVDALTEGFTHESGNQHPKDCFPKDQLTPGELLPGDPNSKWSESVPSGQGELGDQNFLTAGYHVGVNTVGQTLRNANRQIRSEPPNPQVKVSPWLQTTIETDTNRRPLEIGGCK